jgi:hypothetical protein
MATYVGNEVNKRILATDSKESMGRMIKDITASIAIQNVGDIDKSKGISHTLQSPTIDSIAKRIAIQPGRSLAASIDPSINLRPSSIDVNDIMDIQGTPLIAHNDDYTPSI